MPTMRAVPRFRVAVAWLLLAASCGGSGSEDSGGAAAIRALAEQPGLSEFQVGLLSDGELTFPEYEQAVFRVVKCLEDNGFVDIITELLSETDGYNIDFAHPLGADPASVDASQARCFEDSLSAVDDAFLLTYEPSAEEAELQFISLNDCAREILLDAGEHTPEELEIITRELFAEAADMNGQRMYNCSRRP